MPDQGVIGHQGRLTLNFKKRRELRLIYNEQSTFFSIFCGSNESSSSSLRLLYNVNTITCIAIIIDSRKATESNYKGVTETGNSFSSATFNKC